VLFDVSIEQPAGDNEPSLPMLACPLCGEKRAVRGWWPADEDGYGSRGDCPGAKMARERLEARAAIAEISFEKSEQARQFERDYMMEATRLIDPTAEGKPLLDTVKKCLARAEAAEKEVGERVAVIDALDHELAQAHREVAQLRGALEELRVTAPGRPDVFCDHAAEPCDRCDAARAALAPQPAQEPAPWRDDADPASHGDDCECARCDPLWAAVRADLRRAQEPAPVPTECCPCYDPKCKGCKESDATILIGNANGLAAEHGLSPAEAFAVQGHLPVADVPYNEPFEAPSALEREQRRRADLLARDARSWM
jgi:hypothetical protein